MVAEVFNYDCCYKIKRKHLKLKGLKYCKKVLKKLCMMTSLCHMVHWLRPRPRPWPWPCRVWPWPWPGLGNVVMALAFALALALESVVLLTSLVCCIRCLFMRDVFCRACRPCAMVVPDFELICEIMLVAEGFLEARLLARKFITLYSLCKELLSKQVRDS